MRQRVAQSPLSPLTMEIFSPGAAPLFYSDAAARIEPAPVPHDLLTSDSWAFTCGFAGATTVLARVETDLRKFAQECGATNITALDAGQIPGALGRKREFIPIALASSHATTVLKIGALPSKMGVILEDIRAATESESLRCAIMARGVGIIYAALLSDTHDESSRGKTARAASHIQSACRRAGAHATIPWCPSDWKSHLSIWGDDPADLPQMQKLKSIFDPHRILSPGRFVGGM